ncbi:hypothetical protein [Winogradskyella aquimaris]|uniref:DUF4386 domain-containing protein n=1 Tax=Winogradskyella aquimaris TaxID=864074 RepID=A0ABU5EPE0_9FLAO|nr:hypothetical protein [Winogradskyella aquimaris]MDY2588113.1 hypothetical protein [Winogradskyella aquimaris]
MKLAKLFWSAGTLLINFVIGYYVYLQSKAPENVAERYQYLNDNWAAYGGMWKAEFLLMALITVSAFYFALNTRKLSWVIVSVGQLITLMTYPVMLGGYRNTPLEIAEMANEIATVVFVFGNLVLFGGLFLLYLKDKYLKAWLRVLAYAISGFMAIIFSIVFAGFMTWQQAMIVAPLVNILYLINAFYGLKIKAHPEE